MPRESRGLRARRGLCQSVEDYALAAVGALYLVGAFVLEKLGLVEGRTAEHGPRWRLGKARR